MKQTSWFMRCGPHLPVKDLRETLDYYRDQLGFTNEWVEGERDGGISRDDLRLLFVADPEFLKDVNNQRHRLPLLWFVSNIDLVYAEFVQKGIKLSDGLKKYSYGLREFAFIDINGYYIRVAEAAVTPPVSS